MTFKDFFAKLEEDAPENKKDEIKNYLVEYAKNKNIPYPTEYLDSGSAAITFTTNKNDVIIRVQELEDDVDFYDTREYQLFDEDLQESGGVVKVHNFDLFDIDNIRYVATWKEKVDLFIQGFIMGRYKKEDSNKILGALDSLCSVIWEPDRRNAISNVLKTLKSYKETKNLAIAIEKGLPMNDLAVDSNLGVNKKGKVVAFDI